MYQEIKSDNLDSIMQAIVAALDSDETLMVTLNKRGTDYEATLVQAVEPANS